MEDNAIIDLYFQRSEQAIVEIDTKYGGYCYCIAYNILSNREDSEESVNDTYLAAWNTIPPRRPNFFNAFLGKITRLIGRRCILFLPGRNTLYGLYCWCNL